MAIPYAEESEIVGQSGVAEPGALQWHRDASGAPYLSIGTFEGSRDAVRDRDALHRVPYVAIEPPDYSIALGDGATVSNGWFVLWSGEVTQGTPQVREISLAAAAGWEIVAVAVTNIRPDAAQVVFDGGVAKVQCRQTQPAPGFEARTDCAFGIARVLAVDSMTSKGRDNLTMGDYLFTDTVGDCSLGTLREWALGQHRGHMAEDWSRYPADPSRPVRLDGAPLVMDPFHRFRAEVRSGTNDLDTLAICAAGRPALEIVSEVGGTNSAFRILSFSQDGATARMAVTAIGTNVAVLAASGPLSPSMDWAEVEGAAVDYAPDTEGGAPCWRVAFPAAAGRFFRARTTIGAESRTAVRVRAPLVLESPDGGLWRLVVDDDGTLSTEAW